MIKNTKLLLITGAISLTSCGTSYEQVNVTTSMYPHYDLVRQTTKNTGISYALITPPGVEVHSYRPTPKQTAQIQNSDIFFYSTDLIETWVSGMNVKDVSVINVHDTLFSEEHEHDGHEETEIEADDEHNHHHGVHFWTSPSNIIEELDLVVDELSSHYPEFASEFAANAEDYALALTTASEEFANSLVDLVAPTVFFVGHNAMADFGEYFGLEIVSLIEDIKPDADITPAQLAALVDAVVASNAEYLFVEELADPVFGRTVKDELKNKYDRDVEILELHGYHNVTLNDFESEVTYLDLLNRNITNLSEALL